MAIKRLTRQDKTQVVEVLATAFWDYPVMRYVLQDSGDDYLKHLKALVGFFCETRLTREWPLLGILEKGKLVAVAGINEPLDLQWPAELHYEFNQLKTIIGDASFNRLENFEKQSSQNEPDEPHYFLGIIGVLPDYQGKGYSRQLAETVQEMSEKHPESTGVCLSTESPDNVPLYQHLGFEVIGEADVEELHTWCMFRPD